MKKLGLFAMLFVAVTIGFTGCEKGGDDGEDEEELEVETGAEITTPGGKSCLLTKTEEEGDSFYTLYEYDSQKRVVKIKHYDDNVLEETNTITYSNSQINVTGGEPITYTVVNGIVTGGIVPGDNSVTTFLYEHNSAGYLTKRTEITSHNGTSQTSTRVITYTYTDGNMATRQEESGDYSSTATYEYDLSIVNTLLLDEIFINKPNKNALKKRTETRSYQGIVDGTTVDTYTHVLNSDKLITKSTKVEVDTQSGQSAQTSTYVENHQYTCN